MLQLIPNQIKTGGKNKKVQHNTYQKKVQHYLLLFLVKNISLHSTEDI
jgi:hypothetical protein